MIMWETAPSSMGPPYSATGWEPVAAQTERPPVKSYSELWWWRGSCRERYDAEYWSMAQLQLLPRCREKRKGLPKLFFILGVLLYFWPPQTWHDAQRFGSFMFTGTSCLNLDSSIKQTNKHCDQHLRMFAVLSNNFSRLFHRRLVTYCGLRAASPFTATSVFFSTVSSAAFSITPSQTFSSAYSWNMSIHQLVVFNLTKEMLNTGANATPFFFHKGCLNYLTESN